MTPITIHIGDDADERAIERVLEQTHAPVVRGDLAEANNGLALRLDASGLALVSGREELRGDFEKLHARIRSGAIQRELLVKAARIKGSHGMPTAIDATAGLGEDAFLLAAAGFYVELYERDAIIAALLEDAMIRAATVFEIVPIIERMKLIRADSLKALPRLDNAPDVVFLDPMFPARQKSALVKKKFQLLQQLEQPCTDECELLDAAFAAAPHKVVIKRPLKAPALAGQKPHYSLKGKSIRYDCFVMAQGKR